MRWTLPQLFARNSITAALVLIGLMGLTGCASTDPGEIARLEHQALETTQEYVIGPSDILRITVWQQPELTLDDVIVRLDGKISMPLLDDVEAAGKTAQQLKDELTESLTEYVTAPHVTVVVRQINSKNIYVIGEVNREGPIILRGGMRIVDALSTAGGFRAFAAKRRVKLIRTVDNKSNVEFEFNYPAFASGDNLEQNILLVPGDRIVVPEQSAFWR